MPPRTVCPSGQRCINYSDDMTAGPDMDGCMGPCIRKMEAAEKQAKAAPASPLVEVFDAMAEDIVNNSLCDAPAGLRKLVGDQLASFRLVLQTQQGRP